MSHVHIVVEGQTEEAFVRTVLVPHFAAAGIYITQTIVRTKRIVGAPDVVGGVVGYGKLKFDIQRALNNPHIDLVTTMIDLYALPLSFPGRKNCPSTAAGSEKATQIETAMNADIGTERFRAYISVHEFEAFVFVAPEIARQAFPELPCQSQMEIVKNSFATPEDINDSPVTAPSKRLEAICRGQYQKVVHGPLIAETVGLARLREECPHFSEWIQLIDGTA